MIRYTVLSQNFHFCCFKVMAYTPTKVVMWGEVPDVVNNAKFHQNWFRGFGSKSGQNMPFSYDSGKQKACD